MKIFVRSPLILALFFYGESFIKNETRLFPDPGSDVTLNCFCSNNSKSTFIGPAIPSLKDNKDELPSPYTEGFRLNPKLNNTKFMIVSNYEKKECNLQIMNFSREEDGQYLCQYEIMEIVYIHIYNVLIKNTPYIVIAVEPENNNMIEGRDGMICCTVISNLPVMSTKWLKNNEYLQRKNDSKNCFVFAPFNRNDSGHYTCCAENNIGKSNLSIELKILYPPKVTVTHTVGPYYINFTCNASGEPNNYTFLTWEHQSEHHEQIRHFNGTKSRILRVQRTKNLFKQYEDSGYYICRVSNGIPDIKGKTIQQGKLLVLFEDYKSLSFKSSCWQIMGSLLGGSLLFSICSHIYCILKRKKKSEIDLDVPLEVQYDEIGNINIASTNIPDIPNNAQESVFSIDSPFFEGTNNSVSSADSSVQSLPITPLNEDGYEHSYQMLDPANIEIHPYSTVWSNLYQNTTVFQNQISDKYSKDRVPWLIIYNKTICSAEINCDLKNLSTQCNNEHLL